MIELRHLQAVGLRPDRVHLAVHLLQQEIELAAARLGAVGQASQCARWPRNRVTSSLMSERCATRTTSCASAAWIDGRSLPSSPTRSSSRAPQDALRPASAAVGDALDERRPACRGARRGRRADARPRARRIASSASSAPATRGFGAARQLSRFGRRATRPALADRQRLRAAAADRRASARRSTTPLLARLLDGRGRAPARTPRSARPSALATCRSLHDTLTSTRPRASRCCTSARTRGSSVGERRGSRSCRSRNRWLTLATVTPIVALVRPRA